MTTTTTTTHTVPTYPVTTMGFDLDGTFHDKMAAVKTDTILRMGLHRFQLCVTGRNQSDRRVSFGALLPGPHASAFGMCVIISNMRPSDKAREQAAEAALTIDVEFGDHLMIDGATYKIAPAANHNLHLEMIDPG